MAESQILEQPLTLPCGASLKNRILKSAMSESLGTAEGRVTEALPTLYARWAEGGTGLLVTGNVMVDARARVEPGVVVLEDDRDMPLLKRWAQAATAGGTACFVQLSHPGKQCPRGLNRETVSPSAVPFGPKMQGMFATPRALEASEIEDLIERFGRSAELAKQAGFSGVQMHGAHGYLISQFLSPHHNVRTDEWGGTPEKRMRFALRVYDRVRRGVGSDFPVSIKLNSKDFQKGGFTNEESLDVISALSERGIDLIEISGGTYEAPAMALGPRKESTKAREAYFLEFAELARTRSKVPLCVTGGFRSRGGMDAALESGALDLIGLGRSLCLDPDFPNHLLARDGTESKVRPLKTGIGPIDQTGFMEVAWYSRQIHRMGRGKLPKADENATLALFGILTSQGVGSLATRLAKR